jgi:hypothetical protein
MTGMLAKTFLQVKWFHERLKLGENAGANAGVKLRLLRTDAPDDMRPKVGEERFFGCASRPEIGERSPGKTHVGTLRSE